MNSDGIMRVFLLLFSMSFMAGPAQTWLPLGPVNRVILNKSNGQGAGRISCIAFHPNHGQFDKILGDTNRYVFCSSVYGGLWVSPDNGKHWSNKDPGYPGITTDSLPGCGVSTFAVGPAGYDIIAGINYGNGNSIGIYLYRPESGWQPTNLVFDKWEKKRIYKILALKIGKNESYLAATSDGLFRSQDFGKTWESVTGIPKAPIYKIIPSNKSFKTFYACGNMVYRTDDGGVTWEAMPPFASLLKHKNYTLETAIAEGDSGKLFLVAVGQYYKGDPVKKEMDKEYYFLQFRNNAWHEMQGFSKHVEWSADRLTINIHSKNRNFIFAGQELLFRFDAGAKKWTSLSTYGGNMHPDIHAIEFAPDGSLWIGHDGGVSVASKNVFSGQPNWQTRNNGLNIAQVWSFSSSLIDPNVIFIGEVDNGNSYTRNAGASPDSIRWMGYGMADGGEKLCDWSDSSFVFDRDMMYPNSGITKYRFYGEKLRNRGTIFFQITPSGHFNEDWGTRKPIVQDPKRPEILYRGINGLIRSTDGGKTSQMIFRSGVCFPDKTSWGSFITSIAIAPNNPNTVYINTFNPYDSTRLDGVFRIWNAVNTPYVTPQGCTQPGLNSCECDAWEDISPPVPVGVERRQWQKSHITCIVVPELNPKMVYAGYSYNSFVKDIKVLRFTGKKWQNFSEGLPEDVNVNCMVYRNGSMGEVFIGTDDGVYRRTNLMKSWEKVKGMPNVKVVKLEINYSISALLAGTFGRGIWKMKLPS